MNDNEKTKAQLIEELGNLRQQVADLKASQTQYKLLGAMWEEQHDILHILLDNLPVFVYFKDTESRFIFSNAAHLRSMGKQNLDEVIGKTDLELFPSKMAQEFYEDEQELFRTEKALVDKEELSLDQEGNEMWALTTKVPIRNQQGKVIGLVGITHDITERKLSEEKIHKLNARLERQLDEVNTEKRRSESILQNIADAVVFTDVDASVLYVNPAWETLTGYTLYEAIGQNPRILQSGKTPLETYQTMWATILSGNVWRGDLLNKRKDGTKYDAELTVAPIKDTQGEISYFVGIQRDVTEERQLEVMRESFIANAAHDLGNPVSILQTTLYMLKKNPASLDRRLTSLEHATTRLAALVKDLLTLSRLDRNSMTLDLVSVDFNPFVEQIVESQRMLAGEKKQSLIFEPQADVPKILIDSHQIERVIVNLLNNAQNYSPDGSMIHVSTSQDEAMISLAIKDNGMGISPKDLRHIFERFYRSDKAQELSSGTGLGLPIVKEIVELHQGHVEVESVLGEGTVFRVYLPIQVGGE